MKHKRKSYQQKDEGKFYRTNDRIKFSPVLLIDENGEQLGKVPLEEAKQRAISAKLDLVEVAPNSRPIVCRIMDFGKFRYEQSVKDKKQKKSGKSNELKHIRLSPRIAEHDIETKVNQAKKFLDGGHSVQFRLEYKRRENAHKDLGFDVMGAILDRLNEIAEVQREPKLEGRVLHCIVDPK